MKNANLQTLSANDLTAVAGGSLGTWIYDLFNGDKNKEVEAAIGNDKQAQTAGNSLSIAGSIR